MAVSFKAGSVLFGFLRAVFNRYAALERCFFSWLCYSRICGAFLILAGRVYLCMRFSFFAGFSRLGSTGRQQVIGTSIIVGALRRLWYNSAGAFNACWQHATCRRLAESFGADYFFSPARLGIFILAASITDAVILILFGKTIALAGWVAFGILLFAGFCAGLSGTGWDQIRNSSLVLKFIAPGHRAGRDVLFS